MKILILTRHFPEIPGGVSDYSYHLSKFLASQGFKIHVLTSKDKKIKMCQGMNVLAVVEKWNVLGLSGIIKSIEGVSPEVILFQYVPHMYSQRAVPIYIALLFIILRLRGHKVITTFHELSLNLDISRPKYYAAAAVQRLIACIISMLSFRIIVSTARNKKILSLFREKTVILPVGPNIPPVRVSQEETRALRLKVSFSDGVIISSFGLYPKSEDLILEAVSLLIKDNISVRFMMVGGFPHDWAEYISSRAAELGIKEFVYATGFLDAGEVYRYLYASDIFISLHSVDKNGRGGVSAKNTTLASAYAAGLPIIANKGDMTDNFFRDRENIFLIDSLRPEVICEAVRNLISDEKLRQKIRSGARALYESRLQWPVIAGEYASIIKN